MRNSVMARLGMMGLLLIGLLIPLTMMQSVISERTGRRDEAAHAISAEWGGAQTLAGPVLTIPYRMAWKDANGNVRERTQRMFFLPESLTIDGNVEHSMRSRGLFEVVVYTATLKVSGRFARPDLSSLRPDPSHVDWENATVDVGVTDPRGIARRLSMRWGGREITFLPGVTANGLFSTGLRAPAGVPPDGTGSIPFEFEIHLNGTRDFRVLPGGDETQLRLASTWPHPSFSGAPLPRERQVTASGFTASWIVPYFGRGYPSRWTSDEINPEQRRAEADASAFGVTLLRPVDIYQQTERAVKYAALFIVLTFVIAFLWEVTASTLVHPVQYLFVGFAMCVFYLLLLSLAEHIDFDRAYGAAAFATVALLAWYWSWVLNGLKQGVVMGIALVGLYGFLYLLLRLEDYALLAGSIGLFLMLAVVMFLTRRINWYDLRLGTRPNASA
jgi:inner membrane protein